jgi:hypothetical protein
MEYGGEVHRVVAQKPGVGDHAAERFADHELGSRYQARPDSAEGRYRPLA